MTNWHLIQFKPNAHRQAERNLQRQGFETFLPVEEITKRSGSRFTSSLRPLFPGYMFVSAGQDASPWRKINSTIGVSRLVSFGNTHTPLAPGLVAGLMQRCDVEGKLLPADALCVGDSVEVLEGPFTHFVATVEAIDAHQRVWVLMELMGQGAKVQLSPGQIKLAD